MKDSSGSALGTLTRLRMSGFNIALDSIGSDIEELDELLHIPFNAVSYTHLTLPTIYSV